MSARRIKMAVAYDGTEYFGWQTQPQHRTIQGELENALLEITGEDQRIHSSGRTDTGVHAREQVAHFDLESDIAPDRLREGINSLLDADIRVLSIEDAPNEFHARYSAMGKEYRYFVWNHRILPPFLRNYRTHVMKPLDESMMQDAASKLVGEHDFAAFSANPNREIDGTVRDLRMLDVSREGDEICIRAQANGFLYKMVRSLAGFLIRVGTGELPADSAVDILESKLRTATVPTAHPQGLFLWEVHYGDT